MYEAVHCIMRYKHSQVNKTANEAGAGLPAACVLALPFDQMALTSDASPLICKMLSPLYYLLIVWCLSCIHQQHTSLSKQQSPHHQHSSLSIHCPSSTHPFPDPGPIHLDQHPKATRKQPSCHKCMQNTNYKFAINCFIT